MNVMIVVTHLLGTGHLRRAATLARAFSEAGHRVLLVSGGVPVADLDHGAARMLNLPPLKSDGVNFTRLLGQDGHAVDDAFLARRRDALLDATREFSPQCLITELFPFGRRILRAEFRALLDAMRLQTPRPIMLASVRDILAPPSRPQKATQTDQIIAEFYDAVLVHSDPDGTRLENSWPVSPELAVKLRYTGYIAPPPASQHPDATGADEVLVSAGGGSVGTALFECARAAAGMMPDRRWRLLVGGTDTTRIAALKDGAAATTIIEPARPDFRQMLNHAAVSVSLCGYNTALDILQARCPAVFVPFDDGSEVEQGLRADSLAHLPGIAVLRSDRLTPETLCEAVTEVLAAPKRETSALRFDGAEQSVAIAEHSAGAHR